MRVYMQLERQLARLHRCARCSRAPIRPRDMRPRSDHPAALRSSSRMDLAPMTSSRSAPAEDAADFLFVGELRRLKGVDVMLRALRACARRAPCSAVIVGSGPDADAFKDETARLGLDGYRLVPGRHAGTRGVPRSAASWSCPRARRAFPTSCSKRRRPACRCWRPTSAASPRSSAARIRRWLPPEDAGALAEAMLRHARRSCGGPGQGGAAAGSRRPTLHRRRHDGCRARSSTRRSASGAGRFLIR